MVKKKTFHELAMAAYLSPDGRHTLSEVLHRGLSDAILHVRHEKRDADWSRPELDDLHQPMESVHGGLGAQAEQPGLAELRPIGGQDGEHLRAEPPVNVQDKKVLVEAQSPQGWVELLNKKTNNSVKIEPLI